MRKHLVAVFVAGAVLQGGAYVALNATSAGAMLSSAGWLDMAGCARQLTSQVISPREAEAAGTVRPASITADPARTAAEEGATRQVEEAPAREAEGPTSCPANMVLVEGEYCPDVEHTCSKWMETTGRYKNYRCAEYTGAKCLSKERVHKRFCMDRDEYVPAGESLPSSHVSWTDAERTCEGLGKRVCLESEWNFACEGEEMRPYPYGWKRDATACNADRVDIYKGDGSLRDLRVGADDNPRCVSPFGVHNLSGNLEEWTTIDSSAREAHPRPAMKGAYWQPSRNHCRANQTAHDRFYKGTETGFRCCADAR